MKKTTQRIIAKLNPRGGMVEKHKRGDSPPPSYSSSAPDFSMFDEALYRSPVEQPGGSGVQLFELNLWVTASLKIRTNRPVCRVADFSALLVRLVDNYLGPICYREMFLCMTSALLVLIEVQSELGCGMNIYSSQFSVPIKFLLRSSLDVKPIDRVIKDRFEQTVKDLKGQVDLSVHFSPTRVPTGSLDQFILKCEDSGRQKTLTIAGMMGLFGVTFDFKDGILTLEN